MVDDFVVLIYKCMGGFCVSIVLFFLIRWNDIGNIIYNKSTILVEFINKEEIVFFYIVSKMDR